MIQIENLTIQLTNFALQDVSLKVDSSEFFALLGPTGAGKTLILESIAGLVRPSAGRILINGGEVTHLPPERRGVGIVYQDHALFPHLNVRDNITFGLRYHPRSSPHGKASLDLLIHRLGLNRLLDRAVVNLSGGEKQRVALARALAIDPAVLLLDEPLSSLDPNFREEIRQLLKELHEETGITALMVTHDFSEAHFLARRVAVINDGRIEQVGKVSNVFLQPATPFVADFVGMKNIFQTNCENSRAKVGHLLLRVKATNIGHSLLAIRPEHIRLATSSPDIRPPNLLRGYITQIGNQGLYSDVMVEVSGIRLHSTLNTSNLHAMDLKPGCPVFVSVAPEDIHFIST
jgi:molybdate/tungstate transport system ATP-binding protein